MDEDADSVCEHSMNTAPDRGADAHVYMCSSRALLAATRALFLPCQMPFYCVRTS